MRLGSTGLGRFILGRAYRNPTPSVPTPQPTVTHGKQARFYMTVNGSLTDISSYLHTCSMSRTTEPKQVTQLGQSTHQYQAGAVTETNLTFEGYFDPSIAPAIENTTGHTSFAYYPAGTATGQYKFSGTADFTAKATDSDTTKATEIKGELNMTGRPVVTLL